jgi:Protein of unknown function (DUF3429)
MAARVGTGHLTPREACLWVSSGVKSSRAGARFCAAQCRRRYRGATPAAARGMIRSPMEPVQDHPAATRLNAMAEWVGYLGAAPLVLCLAGLGLLPDPAQRELAQRIALAWGAVLLSFTGAVHWGLTLAGRLPWEAARGAALLPALVGGAAIVVGGQVGFALLVLGFGLWWLYEHRALGTLLPLAYLNLRRHLTLAICVLLALTMIASDAAGLR